MSIADKLQELIDSKADMKSAIAEKGVEVEGGLVTYADAIRQIQQGSGEGGSDIDWSGVRFGGSTRIPLAPNELYKCGDMDHMFMDCDLWLLGQNFDFSSLSTSFASSFESLFESTLTGLIDFNHLDTSNVINYSRVLKDSVLLMDGYIPIWDTHNGENFYEAFASSDIDIFVTYIPQWDFSNAVNVDGLVSGLFGLVSIPKLNFSKVKSDNMFGFPLYYQPEVGSSSISARNLQYLNLTDLGGFTGLKYCFFNLGMCPNLTVESLMNVINEMYDWNINPDNLNMEDWGSNQNIYNTAVLEFGEVNLNKLTDEQIAVAIAKGWTLI